jgi:hypothetical protein
MGGISFVVGFESIADPPGDPGALREALWEHATGILYRYLGRPGNRDVLYYASDELHDRAEQGVRGSDIHFTFMDCAGCCNRSMDASFHWMEVAFSLDRPGFERAAEKSGFRLTKESPSVAALVRQGSDPVFMHIGDKLWAVGRRAPGSPLEELWGDSASLEVAELSEKDRAVAERISLTGRCHCELCSHARKIVKPKKPRGQKTEDRFDDKALDANIPKAEALLASEGAKARIDAAIKDLKAWGDAEWAGAPAGPPAFQELQAWLASEGAAIATIGLTGTLFYIDARARRGY